MGAKHTPAPWGSKSVRVRLATFLASVNYEDAEADANSALIKAAPDLMDFALNISSFDDRLLLSADVNLLRATLREFREEARKLLAQAEAAS